MLIYVIYFQSLHRVLLRFLVDNLSIAFFSSNLLVSLFFQYVSLLDHIFFPDNHHPLHSFFPFPAGTHSSPLAAQGRWCCNMHHPEGEGAKGGILGTRDSSVASRERERERERERKRERARARARARARGRKEGRERGWDALVFFNFKIRKMTSLKVSFSYN